MINPFSFFKCGYLITLLESVPPKAAPWATLVDQEQQTHGLRGRNRHIKHRTTKRLDVLTLVSLNARRCISCLCAEYPNVDDVAGKERHGCSKLLGFPWVTVVVYLTTIALSGKSKSSN